MDQRSDFAGDLMYRKNKNSFQRRSRIDGFLARCDLVENAKRPSRSEGQRKGIGTWPNVFPGCWVQPARLSVDLLTTARGIH